MRNKQVNILIKGEEEHRLGHQNKPYPNKSHILKLVQDPRFKLKSVPLGFLHFKRMVVKILFSVFNLLHQAFITWGSWVRSGNVNNLQLYAEYYEYVYT